MIRIACPKCSERLVLDDETCGQVGECPECNARFRIPAAPPSRPQKGSLPVPDEEEEDDRPKPKRKKAGLKNRRRPRGDGPSFEFTGRRVVGLLVIVWGLVVTIGGFSDKHGGAYGAGAKAGGVFGLLFITAGIVRVIKG